jgi:hypothetical protein
MSKNPEIIDYTQTRKNFKNEKLSKLMPGLCLRPDDMYTVELSKD